MTEFSVAQGIEIPLTSEDTASITAAVSTKNGRGSGALTTSFRRVMPDSSWFRVRLILMLFVLYLTTIIELHRSSLI